MTDTQESSQIEATHVLTASCMGVTELNVSDFCVNHIKSVDPTTRKICPCVPIEVLHSLRSGVRLMYSASFRKTSMSVFWLIFSQNICFYSCCI